jgi:hypothetical protein
MSRCVIGTHTHLIGTSKAGLFPSHLTPCPHNRGKVRLLAAIQDPDSIERVLRAMGLPWQAPELAVARAPPEVEGGWLGA